MKITHEMNMHNCQLCRNECLGRCHHDKHYGKDVSVNNVPCDDYEYGGTEERLEEIERCEKEKSRMTAFDYSEKKINILKTMNSLEEYLYNDTDTVLLTNGEVKDIMASLKDCTMIIDEKLKAFQ